MSFVTPATFTLADAIHAIETRPELGHSAKRRIEIARDIRIVAGWLDREPAEVPASIHALQHPLKDLHHGPLGISKGRFRNVLSNLRRGLEAVRVTNDVPLLRAATDLPPEWRDLYLAIPPNKDWLKGILRQFICWCADTGVSPEDVDYDTFQAWKEWRRTAVSTLARDPERPIKKAIDAWNHAQRHLGWPGRRVERPDRRTRVTRPLETFSTDFQESVEAFIADNSTARDDLDDRLDACFDDEEASHKPLSSRTMKTRVETILLAASTLVDTGKLALDDLVSVDQVATPRAAAATVQAVIDRSGKPPTEYALTIFKGLRNVAARRKLITQQDLAWWRKLKRMIVKKGNLRNDMTAKNRTRLAAFHHEAAVRRLLQLPHRLVEQAEADRSKRGRVSHTMACRVEVAAAMAVLLTLPVRRQNLTTVEIDRHITWPLGRRDRSGLLRFEPDEVKTHLPIAAGIPEHWMDILRLYRRHYRPRLSDTAKKNLYLFPARTSLGHKNPNDLARLISVTIARETGLKVNTHLFRHICGLLLLKGGGNPDHVRALLGHVKDGSATRRYVEFLAAEAARKLDDALAVGGRTTRKSRR